MRLHAFIIDMDLQNIQIYNKTTLNVPAEILEVI